MYCKQSGHQAQYCQQVIFQALLRLMEQYPLQEITITQICQEAKISRTSFYRNYNRKEDVLAHHLEVLLSTIPHSDASHAVSAAQISDDIFQFIYENRVYLKLLQTHDVFFLYKEIALRNKENSPYMQRLYALYDMPALNAYLAQIFIETQFAIMEQWIRDDCVIPVENISQLSIKVFNNLCPGWRDYWKAHAAHFNT